MARIEDVMKVASVEIHPDPASLVPQTASIGAVVAVIMGYLPVFVAIIPAVYYLFLIWETKTVTQWRKRRRARKLRKVRQKLRAKRDAD